MSVRLPDDLFSPFAIRSAAQDSQLLYMVTHATLHKYYSFSKCPIRYIIHYACVHELGSFTFTASPEDTFIELLL